MSQPHLRIRLLASLLALIILSLMPLATAQQGPYTVDTLTFDAMGNEPRRLSVSALLLGRSFYEDLTAPNLEEGKILNRPRDHLWISYFQLNDSQAEPLLALTLTPCANQTEAEQLARDLQQEYQALGFYVAGNVLYLLLENHQHQGKAWLMLIDGISYLVSSVSPAVSQQALEGWIAAHHLIGASDFSLLRSLGYSETAKEENPAAQTAMPAGGLNVVLTPLRQDVSIGEEAAVSWSVSGGNPPYEIRCFYNQYIDTYYEGSVAQGTLQSTILPGTKEPLTMTIFVRDSANATIEQVSEPIRFQDAWDILEQARISFDKSSMSVGEPITAEVRIPFSSGPGEYLLFDYCWAWTDAYGNTHRTDRARSLANQHVHVLSFIPKEGTEGWLELYLDCPDGSETVFPSEHLMISNPSGQTENAGDSPAPLITIMEGMDDYHHPIGQEVVFPLTYSQSFSEDMQLAYRWIVTDRFFQKHIGPLTAIEGQPAFLSFVPSEGLGVDLELQITHQQQPPVLISKGVGLKLPYSLILLDRIIFNKPFVARLIIDYPHGNMVSFSLDLCPDENSEKIIKVTSPDGWIIDDTSGCWCTFTGQNSKPQKRLVLDFLMTVFAEDACLFIDGEVWDQDGGEGWFDLLRPIS